MLSLQSVTIEAATPDRPSSSITARSTTRNVSPQHETLEMTDNDLINSLAADLRPVERHRTERDLALAVGAGTIASAMLVWSSLGIQNGLDGPAIAPVIMKDFYGLALAAIGGVAALHLSRPGSLPCSVKLPLASVFATLAGIAAVQLTGIDRTDLATMVIGSSWQWCSVRIVALALPIFAAMVIMLRRQAPVRPRRAGAAAGLVAGALSSSIYAFACTEQSAAFVLVWYTAGIAVTTAIGWLAGPKLLHW